MAKRYVRLSGEHATLPVAELRSLLAVHAPGSTVELVMPTVALVDGENVDHAIGHTALAHDCAEAWGHGPLDTCLDALRPVAGSVAVRSHRDGPKGPLSRRETEQTIGMALQKMGSDIDLTNPMTTIVAWIHHDQVAIGPQISLQSRSRFDQRHVTDRAHFSPVGMHPRRAASLIHLARVNPGRTILDPFCGTGGIVLEAAETGFKAIGSDLDNWMVQGTMQCLADAGPEPLAGEAFQADIAEVPNLLDRVDGIVTDLPYGRASTTDGEGVGPLYERAFGAFAKLLAAGTYAVFGCADEAVGLSISQHGFEVLETHAEYVHKSLTRHYIVARRR